MAQERHSFTIQIDGEVPDDPAGRLVLDNYATQSSPTSKFFCQRGTVDAGTLDRRVRRSSTMPVL